MQKTRFEIPKMDCPSEENLIRMKLDGIAGIKHLDFEIPDRKLTVYHNGQLDQIEQSILQLNLGGKKLTTKEVEETDFDKNDNQKQLLLAVLVINLAFFIIEITTGLISKSIGLVADSLDMLADAFVYGISLYAVGGTLFRKRRIAEIAGYCQITLAIVGFYEVIQRFLDMEKVPDYRIMIIVAFFALIANGVCLYLLQKSKGKEEAHMKASMIFTSNDIIINVGVIAAGLLVHWLNSSAPDMLIGTIVFILVIRGGIRILKLGN